MNPLQLLSMLRNVSASTVAECDRQEFKAEVIYKNHNAKLGNIQANISSNASLNAKQKAKLLAEVKKLTLAPAKTKSYESVKLEVKAGTSKLTSAIELMKR